MLAHYWTPDTDKAAQRALIRDWIHDLKEFPVGAIEGAIITWRQTQTRRPTPADIRKLILPQPEPSHAADGGAHKPFTESKPTFEQLAKHRQAIAPMWKLVARAKAGENADYLIRARMRFTRKMFARDPELRHINAIIEHEEREERHAR